MSQPAVSLDDVGYQDLRIVADRLLETTRVEYVDEGVLLVINPPGIEHRRIVRAIVDDAKRAFYTGAVTVNWAADENYQWDLPDGSGRFYVPDIVFIHPGATTAEEERTAIVLVVEVTSPTSPDTVLAVIDVIDVIDVSSGGSAILRALGSDVNPEIAPHIQGLMRKDIEHFADAIRAYGLDPQPLHDRGLAGTSGLAEAVGLLAADAGR